MAVSSASVAHSTAACAGPATGWGACSAAGDSLRVAEIDGTHDSMTCLSLTRGLCGVFSASHSATNEEAGHGET